MFSWVGPFDSSPRGSVQPGYFDSWAHVDAANTGVTLLGSPQFRSTVSDSAVCAKYHIFDVIGKIVAAATPSGTALRGQTPLAIWNVCCENVRLPHRVSGVICGKGTGMEYICSLEVPYAQVLAGAGAR